MKIVKLQEKDLVRIVQIIVETQSTTETCEQLKEKLKTKARNLTRNQNLITAFDRAIDTDSLEPLLSFVRNSKHKNDLVKKVEEETNRLLSNNKDIEGVLSQFKKEVDRDLKASSIKPSDFDKNKYSKEVTEQNPWNLLDMEAQYGQPIGWMTMPWGTEVPIYDVRKLKGWAKFMWVAGGFLDGVVPVISLILVFFAWRYEVREGNCR
jgi:hypothetical protein